MEMEDKQWQISSRLELEPNFIAVYKVGSWLQDEKLLLFASISLVINS